MAATVALNIRQGWTERIKYALTHDGVIQDLTDMTVELVGEIASSESINFIGTVGVDGDPTLGVVYFDPDVIDLLNSLSPYRVRWKITDILDKTAYFPRSGPLIWIVDLP